MSSKKSPHDNASIDTPGSRLRAERENLSIKQVPFVKKLGISQNYLSELERGEKKLKEPLLSTIEYRYGISAEYLLTGEGPKHVKAGAFNEPALPFNFAKEPVLIPLLGKISAGFPKDINNDVIEYLHLPDAPQNAYALIVDGDSMAPRIKHGDYVVFVEDGSAKDGDVVVIRDEWGDPILKRYRSRKGEILLTSDNPEYPTIQPNEQYRIIGKVIDIWTRKKAK